MPVIKDCYKEVTGKEAKNMNRITSDLLTLRLGKKVLILRLTQEQRISNSGSGYSVHTIFLFYIPRKEGIGKMGTCFAGYPPQNFALP